LLFPALHPLREPKPSTRLGSPHVSRTTMCCSRQMHCPIKTTEHAISAFPHNALGSAAILASACIHKLPSHISS
jgi:hypothetical protein